jgi:two-component system, sporulation sensor kinase E
MAAMAREYPPGRSAEELVLENEARLRMALDGANVGLFEWNVHTNESKWSTGFYLLHGLEPSVPPSYELWRQQIHPDDVERVEREVRKAVSSLHSVDTDYRIRHSDGKLRWTLLQASVRADERGRAEMMWGFCGDITRRKLAEAALLESERLAITGRLSAAIAHEINNPLEAAFNLLYLARGLASATAQTQLLDQAVEQLRRVSEISSQTLRFSRPAKPRVIKLSDVVQSTLGVLGPKLKLASLTVLTDYREHPEILCAPGEIQQVLTNVINNAVDAMNEQGVLRIRVRRSSDWRDPFSSGVRITVADSGSGMPPETVRRIREPFFTTKGEGTGTGLGMWVVQELVTKYKGHLVIRTSTRPANRGTTLSLFFPASPG